MAERTAEVIHIPELDGVRGLAVLFVLLLHFHDPFQQGRPLGLLSDVIARGYTGVDMFFVLSGFLITSILISTRHASNYFQAFYARRSLRIFPLAFLWIALFYWIALPLAHRHGQLPKLPESEQIWYWLFLGNWRQGLGLNDGATLGHFWSLGIEEQFYLLFSLIARYLRAERLYAVCIALILSSVALRALFAWDNPYAWRITFLQLDPIALGALLACSGKALQWASRWRWPLMLIGVLGLAFPLPAGMPILAGSIGAAGLVAAAATRVVPLLRWPVLRSCGKYSYGMYVLHPAWIAAVLAKRYPGSRAVMLGVLVLGPLLSYAMAVVSWNVLEKHFLKMKRYFPYKTEAGAGGRQGEPEIVVSG